MTTDERPLTALTEAPRTTLPLPTVGGRSSLSGVRVVITRSAGKADGMAQRLRDLGAEPIIYPTIAYAPPEDTASLDAALARLSAGEYDWLILTSAQAVRAVIERNSPDLNLQSAICNLQLAAVGPATATSCVNLLGVSPATVPEQFVAEELAEKLGDLTGKKVLLPNADIARPVLEERLRASGALVDRVVAYRTVPAPDSGVDLAALLAADAIGVITFTSGSTARAFVQKIGPDAVALSQRAVIACIGPSTATACRAIGLVPHVVAEVSTEEGLVEALIAHMEVR
ncbi:MAG: uroporphyrinogen-III synthase [Chloroflexales bacterium]|jgi:uroporphyrinogen-III synthase